MADVNAVGPTVSHLERTDDASRATRNQGAHLLCPPSRRLDVVVGGPREAGNSVEMADAHRIRLHRAGQRRQRWGHC